MKTIKEVLVQAKQILVQQGWCQGQYTDNKGRCCMSEAIQRVHNPDPKHSWLSEEDGTSQAHSFLYKFLRGSIAKWNDTDGRTQEEVLSKLDEAIEAAEKQ